MLGERPDQLLAPRLLDPLGLEGELRRGRSGSASSALLRHEAIIPLTGVERVRMRRDVLLGAAEVLRRVDGQPQALVAERAQTPLGGELRERGRLVVAALGQAGERLLAEDVEAGVDPVRQRGRLAEAASRRRRRRPRRRRTATLERATAIVAAPPSASVALEAAPRGRRRAARRRSARRRRRSRAARPPRSAARRRGRAAPAPRRRRSPAPSPASSRLEQRLPGPAAQLTITRSTPAPRARADLVRGERPAARRRRAPSAGPRRRRRAARPCRRRG